jgi:hypothetical protein
VAGAPATWAEGTVGQEVATLHQTLATAQPYMRGALLLLLPPPCIQPAVEAPASLPTPPCPGLTAGQHQGVVVRCQPWAHNPHPKVWG